MRENLATASRRRTPDGDTRYRRKKVWARPSRQAFIIDKFEGAGWEFVGRGKAGFATQLTFRREAPETRWGWWAPKTWFALLLAAALLVAGAVVVIDNGPRWQARYEAWAAVRALNKGNLDAVEERLAEHRGNLDFAYYFAAKATPRALGDALATVAGNSKDNPLKSGVDPHQYELTLTDLAGTLALATHGIGDRALPTQWTTDFVTATTKPSDLYKVEGGIEDRIPFQKTDAEKRRDQDKANKANLLLLLSRGYWSSDFLQEVTTSYYEYDRDKGVDAWQSADPGDDVGYAPAPSGAYLTDGILALTAALTANPAASEWAFTRFKPGVHEIEDSDNSIGKFTHFLLFEHEFPESGSESIGMTATLTALSSAIDATSWAEGPEGSKAVSTASADVGPMHDVDVLQTLARQLNEPNKCSWWVLNCIDNVLHLVARWGHLVLNILTVATSFAPPPFNIAAAATGTLNATWYAIEGDYTAAGLSLAAAVPGLAFTKIAKAATSGKEAATTAKAAKAARNSNEITKVASESRIAADGVDALRGADKVVTRRGMLGTKKAPLKNEKAFETYLAKKTPGLEQQKTFNPPGCETSCAGKSYADLWDPVAKTVTEAKYGIRNPEQAVEQLQKYLALRDSGAIKNLKYAFAADKNGVFGPSAAFKALLERYDVPYVIVK